MLEQKFHEVKEEAMEVEEDGQGAHPKLVVGLYESVEGEGIPKSFPLKNSANSAVGRVGAMKAAKWILKGC